MLPEKVLPGQCPRGKRCTDWQLSDYGGEQEGPPVVSEDDKPHDRQVPGCTVELEEADEGVEQRGLPGGQ